MQRSILCLATLGALCVLGNANPLKANDAEIQAQPNYRLDNLFEPTNYDIHLTLPADFETEETFTGTVTIDITPGAKSGKSIRLHKAKEMNITALEIDDVDKDVETIIDYDNTTEIMKINLGKKFTESFTLKFEFDGKLYTDMYGFYLSTYGPENAIETIATTQFQPAFARRAFPCFDEPSFKATFDIKLTIPSGFDAVSNQPSINMKPGATDKTITFKQTTSMSTYLVAFVVSNFKSTSVPDSSASSFPMNIWTPSELKNNAIYASTVSRTIIDNLGNILSADPNEDPVTFDEMDVDHLDQVAIPDFAAGAMENWGLVTYRETALLWDENESTVKDKQRVATVIAHEFAHSWFGNWVTTAWWDNTWLNEGFANYFEYHGLIDIPEMQKFELDKQFIVDEVQVILGTDGNAGALPLQSDANTVSEIQAKFGTITYSKGGSIVRMMEKIEGKPTFMKNLQKYINNHKTGSSVPEDLFEVFADIDKVPFAEIMQNWIEKAGYPVINAKLSDGKVTVAQKQFYYEKPAEADDTKWYVPISYEILDIPKATTTVAPTTTEASTKDPSSTVSTGSSTEKPTTTVSTTTKEPTTKSTTTVSTTTEDSTELPTDQPLVEDDEIINEAEFAPMYRPIREESKVTWLKPEDTDKTITDLDESSFIIINKQNAGYYRVNYDTELWQRIINSLQANHAEIDVVTRAQLIDDAMNLARADELDYKTAMTLVSYLEKETEYYPWKAALTAFSFLRKRLVGNVLRDQISGTMSAMLSQFYNDNEDFDVNGDEENPIDVYKRVLALEWACELGIKNCTDKAKAMFENMIKNTRSADIDANVRSTVYCSGLRQSDSAKEKANWNKLWAKYSESDVMNEKVTILTALGCTKNEDLLKAYLQMSINDTSIRPQDASSVFKAVLTGNPEGIDIALNFLNDDFKDIAVKYGSMGALSSVIIQVADRLTTKDQLEKFTTFVTENEDELLEAADVAKNAINTAQANLDWADSKLSELNNYFNGPDDSGATSLVSTSMLGLLICAFVARIL